MELLIAIEFIISRIALLTYVLDQSQRRVAQASEHFDGDIESDIEQVKHVIRERNTLSRVDDSLDIDLLIKHGFTCRLLKQLASQRNLPGLQQSVSRHVENLHQSVDLKVSVQEVAPVINRRSNLEY